MRIEATLEHWPLKKPFKIASTVYETTDILVIKIFNASQIGVGEAAGVDYLGEKPETLLSDALTFAANCPADLTRQSLQTQLPPGGLRNAIDCALWDLEAKTAGKRFWELANRPRPPTRTTFFTLGLDTPEAMAIDAGESPFRQFKLKLGDEDDIERLLAVRKARPDARIIVDANCAWTPEKLHGFMPTLLKASVEVIEQPLSPETDDALKYYNSPITLCADESCQEGGNLKPLALKYKMVNIKLDKTGGLTQALFVMDAARALGLKIMVGCMSATSLGIAPALLVAANADIVDLDWHLLNSTDRSHSFPLDGFLPPPSKYLWG